jgi:hypothetical protein
MRPSWLTDKEETDYETTQRVRTSPELKFPEKL